METVVDFDFSHFAELAQNDPEGFERARQRLIDELIEQAPAGQQQRLRGLQFRIDMERRRAKTPYAACVRVSRMMWETFNHEFRPALRRLVEGAEPLEAPIPADVLHFPGCTPQPERV